MATISWNIANLERDTEDDFVFTAHWTVNAIEEEDGQQFFGRRLWLHWP
jgi:hypothetical protein